MPSRVSHIRFGNETLGIIALRREGKVCKSSGQSFLRILLVFLGLFAKCFRIMPISQREQALEHEGEGQW